MDERPRPFHLAGLEVVPEGAQVGVPEEAAVGVVGPGGAALVAADLRAVRALLAVGLHGRGQRGRLGAGARLRRGPLLGAVVLAHQVLDAMLGGVIRQVAPAGPRRAPHAAVVGAQRRAELLLLTGARGGGPEFRVAPEDLALQARCRGGGEGGGTDVRIGSLVIILKNTKAENASLLIRYQSCSTPKPTLGAAGAAARPPANLDQETLRFTRRP